jgi:glutathione S-transferase
VAKPEIIGSTRSSYTRVVRMVCEEKGIGYDLTETLLGAAEIRALHPFGKMPVLRHGDLVLCESKAIATYLDRAFDRPRLIPSEPREAALTEQWISLVNTAIDPLLVRRYLLSYAAPKTADGKPDRALIETLLPDVRSQLALLDAAVAPTNHLVGDQFTLADIYLLPMLFYLKLLPESGPLLAPSTALGRYLETHAARPSYISTIPPLSPPRRSTGSS